MVSLMISLKIEESLKKLEGFEITETAVFH